MRAFFWAALFTAVLGTNASAQFAAIGPVAITNKVNGVPITVSATSWITVNSADNERTVDTRIFVDLIDLQRKFPDVVDSFKLSTTNCAKREADNRSPVVSLKSGSLLPVDDQLIMSVRGNVDLWSCKASPAKSEYVWKKKKIGFIKIKLPVLHTKKAAMKKTMDGTQPFRGNLPIQLIQKGSANVALKIVESEIKLEGQDAIVTNANLNQAKVDINSESFRCHSKRD